MNVVGILLPLAILRNYEIATIEINRLKQCVKVCTLSALSLS